jgi:hypothetical protein
VLAACPPSRRCRLPSVPYEHSAKGKPVKLPARQRRKYERPPEQSERLVPERYVVE